MKKVQKTIDRWVQRIGAKTRSETPAEPARRPQQLDSQALTRVSGGGPTSQTPNKGW
jgi:hypothetical protein